MSESTKLRVMYIAPRLHPNQNPILEGWIRCGDEVCFLSRTEGAIEDHPVLEPILLGTSRFHKIKNIDCFSGENIQYRQYLKERNALPPIRKYVHLVKDFHPNVVIIRDRSLYTFVCCWIAKIMGSAVVLYNQSPIYTDYKLSKAKLWAQRVLFPKVRITPVLQRRNYVSERELEQKKYRDKYAYYVPFVMNGHCKPEDKTYFQNNRINLLVVGRFEKRKQHIQMLEVMNQICQNRKDICLHLVGECSNKEQRQYVLDLQEYIRKNNLQEYVSILQNLDVQHMKQEYLRADIFVLPSIEEPAAISPLEAMSYSIPCVLSDDNGTASYIVPRKSGAIFRGGDIDELRDKLLWLLESKERICECGKEAYRYLEDNCGFEQYRNTIKYILENSKNMLNVNSAKKLH